MHCTTALSQGLLAMRKIAFALTLFFIFTIPWEAMIQLRGLGTMSKFVGFGAAAFWLATIILTGRIRRPTLFHFIVTLFVIWNAVSVFGVATLIVH